MARIGIFTDTWLPNINGVTFSVLNQIKVLEADHELFLFVPRTAADKLEKIPDSVEIIEFPGLEFPSYPGYKITYGVVSRKLRRAAKEQRLDLLHAQTPFFLGWASMLVRRIQKIPMVATFHTHLAEYAGHIFKGICEEQVKRALWGATWDLIRNQYNHYDITFTPSKSMRWELIEHGVNRVIDMPNPLSPVFLETTSIPAEQKQHFRKRFGIPQEAQLLVYVGRIAFEKRLGVLLKAFKGLEQRHKDVYLAIVGDGPQMGMYKKMARELGLKNYVFTSYVSHQKLPTVYQTAQVFISPSDTETQGLTFLEAMSQGCPVIAVRSRGVADYIKHEQNGFFANKLDPAEFEGLIERALTNPEEMRMIRTNARKTAELYDYDHFRQRLLRGYRMAIAYWDEQGRK